MARKREDHTPTIRAKAPSGWCIDKLHDACRGAFIYSDCNCACHDTPKPVAPAKKRGRPKKETVTITDDPRPWRK